MPIKEPMHPPPHQEAVLIDAFLLTRSWRDRPEGTEIEFWARAEEGPIRIVLTEQENVCFFARDTDLPAGIFRDMTGAWRRISVDLATPEGAPVDAIYLTSQRNMQRLRQEALARGLTPYEADLKPTDRYLMERFITGGMQLKGTPIACGRFLELHNPAMRSLDYRPSLRIAALDIETSDLNGDLYSIALSSPEDERVLMVGTRPLKSDELTIEIFRSEADLLRAFFDWVQLTDPDVFIGWNVIGFDLDFLAKRSSALRLPFLIGRSQQEGIVRRPNGPNQTGIANIPGRVVLDGIESLRAAFWTFPDYSLEAVSQKLLGQGKKIAEPTDRVREIRRLYAEDPIGLAHYNIEDSRLVRKIFSTTDLLDFFLERSQLTGLTLGRIGGAVAAFDHLYLPRLHRCGFVAPDTGTIKSCGTSPGGHILNSKPDLYRFVTLLDFKSLYPSIIRSFAIDPKGLWWPGEDPIPGFDGARFARHGALLPNIVAELGARRDEAKRAHNQPLSQAIKIIMNSFYGVLGTTGCRFMNPQLTSSITRRGHEIIQRSRDLIEASGFSVIYGDTDSLFVSLADIAEETTAIAAGKGLADHLNRWWRETLAREYRVESYLEVEFEHLFLRFLMPTVRGADIGTKKRYAGMVRTEEGRLDLVFKGLESVRTDWTELAQQFQRELYRRVFSEEPFNDYVRDIDHRLLSGEFDDMLIYRKRLRRTLKEYAGTGPPHVQAARKLDTPSRWVRYVITRAGPQPVEIGPHALDYEHYRQRQLAPVADTILQFCGTSYENLTTPQLRIFPCD